MSNYDPSGFFEEYVGRFFDALGCDVESQPQIDGGLSDYLATTPDRTSFYVEATVMLPKQFSNPRPAEEDVCRKLREICQVPHFYWFWAWANGELYRFLGKKELDSVKRWIEGLSTDDPRPEAKSFRFPGATPTGDARDLSPDWEIEIHAFPRSEPERGIPGTLLAGFGRAGFIDSVSPLINKVRDKVKQHKHVKKAVVLAINDMADFPLDQIDMSVALFGWEQSAESGISRITPPRENMRKRSIWGKEENSTISGILMFSGVSPHSGDDPNVCLYVNPSARYPIPKWLTVALPHAFVAEECGILHLFWPRE